jgi:hypothetical protein
MTTVIRGEIRQFLVHVLACILVFDSATGLADLVTKLSGLSPG